MKLNIRQIDATTIEVTNQLFSIQDLGNVLIIKIPNIYSKVEADKFANVIGETIKDKHIIVCGEDIQFCQLELMDKNKCECGGEIVLVMGDNEMYNKCKECGQKYEDN